MVFNFFEFFWFSIFEVFLERIWNLLGGFWISVGFSWWQECRQYFHFSKLKIGQSNGTRKRKFKNFIFIFFLIQSQNNFFLISTNNLDQSFSFNIFFQTNFDVQLLCYCLSTFGCTNYWNWKFLIIRWFKFNHLVSSKKKKWKF